MRQLWDPAAVRRLQEAVKRRSPDDWKASRKLRAARRRGRHEAGTWFWRGIGTVGLIASLGTPLHADVGLSETAAMGLLGWHLAMLGLLSGASVFRADEVDVAPLANTPLGLVSVYRHVLGKVRRRALSWLVCGWLATWAAAAWLLLWHGQTDAAGAWPRLFAGSVFIYALSASGALLPRLLPWSGWGTCGGTLGLVFAVLWIWQLLCLDKDWIRPPEEVGQWFAWLPQSDVIRWISGGELSGTVLVCGAVGVGILGNAFRHVYRDRSDELGTEETFEEPLITAEFVAAAALREWRTRLRDAAAAESSEETGADGEPDDEDEDGEVMPPLPFHPHAPRHHATPVSAEYRGVMREEVRRLLALPEAEGPAGRYLAYRDWPFHPLVKTLRWALLLGGLGPLLLLGALLCREHHAPAWILPGLDLGFALVLSCLVTFPVAPGFGLPALQAVFTGMGFTAVWRSLPVPVRTHHQAFVAWSRRVFWRRGLFCAAGFAAAVATAHLALSLLLAADLAPRQCPDLGRLWSGSFSLTQFGVALLTFLAVIRALRLQPFVAGVNAHFRGRGWWRVLYGIAILCGVGAVGCAASAGGWVMVRAGSPGGAGLAAVPWAWIGMLVFLAELIGVLGTRLFLCYASRGRAE